ncbi:MAG: sulfur carrier protein ThiS [Candidatus Accumulibacter sp.]|jgi:thiamine biosynthesis protein ThiS|nr:sulfur carrier protein ThiS [Accumulibacter sp.]
MITVNGVKQDLPETLNLAAFLEARSYARDRVVVEINRVIVPKTDYPSAVLRDGDALEILSFVSGG